MASGKGDTKKQRRKRSAEVAPIERMTLDIKEAAAYLGISEQLAYAEAKEDRLPVVRIRGRILVVKALLDEMIMSRALATWKRD
jgi:excisionase family DNA binding protein